MSPMPTSLIQAFPVAVSEICLPLSPSARTKGMWYHLHIYAEFRLRQGIVYARQHSMPSHYHSSSPL